mgnify:CR=1 FL=1
MHRLQELVCLHRKGLTVREVARRLGVSPNTERAYRHALEAEGLLLGEGEVPDLATLRAAVEKHLPAKPVPQQASSIERWAGAIGEALQRGAGPKAIHDMLRLEKDDYDGSYDAMKRFVRRWRKVRGPQPEDVAIPVDTEPGQVAQIDFGYLGKLYDPDAGRMRKSWVFVLVLGFSRLVFARITFDQKTDTWLRLHIEAFAALGGVPAEFVPDNLKAAVIRSAFGSDREDTALNRSYRDLARHYGFMIDPAPRREPKKKGKVESGVKYVRNNFWKPRDLVEIGEAQSELARWVEGIANQRDHGTTGRMPQAVFDEIERAVLQPLPARPYVPVVWKRARVHPNSHVLFEKREYSVPWPHIGSEAWVRATPDTVVVYIDDERVQTHDRRGKGPRSTVETDLPEHRRELRHRSRDYWLRRARTIDERVEAYVQEVFDSDDVLSQLRVVQAIVTLLENYTVDRAIAACDRAHYFGNHTYRGVRDILRKGLDMQPLPMTLFAPANQPTRPRFSRAPIPEEAT